MSDSGQMGRCRMEVDSYRKPEFHYAAIADAIDRLAADVAAVKEAVCDGSVAAERDRFLPGWALRSRNATPRSASVTSGEKRRGSL